MLLNGYGPLESPSLVLCGTYRHDKRYPFPLLCRYAVT